MRYIPPYDVVRGLFNLTTVRGKTRVDMTLEETQNVIRALLTAIPVDPTFYLQRNPDVAEGIEQGTIRSAQDHFVDHGYFEGRLPYHIEVDEDWYLTNHEDVARTVRSGEYRSGQNHFDGPGYPEGRTPFPLER